MVSSAWVCEIEKKWVQGVESGAKSVSLGVQAS